MALDFEGLRGLMFELEGDRPLERRVGRHSGNLRQRDEDFDRFEWHGHCRLACAFHETKFFEASHV